MPIYVGNSSTKPLWALSKGLTLGAFVVSDYRAMSMHFEAFTTSCSAAKTNKKHGVPSIVSKLFVKHFTIEMYYPIPKVTNAIQ